jgi:exportin-5
MNGSAYGSVSTAAKPNHDAGNNSSNADLLSRIRQALEVVHSPYSSNDSRKEASIFLEEVKSNEEAPYHGFTLARDQSQEAVVRHYSLSLLEHGIKRHWQNYSINQQVALRRWVLELSQNVSGRDPTYLQNKTAQLWVEVAKRSWGGEEWLDMDTLLVQLWTVSESLVHKSFVLTVLETLSEEVFGGDDAAVVLRETALKKALLEIFTPIAVLDKHFPKRQSAVALRFGEEGWLHRLGTFINQALRNEVVNNEEYRACAVKTVAVYRSAVTWVGVWAIAETNVVEVLIRCLSTSHVPLQMVRLIVVQSDLR